MFTCSLSNYCSKTGAPSTCTNLQLIVRQPLCNTGAVADRNSEKKIDRIEDRLTGIEEALKRLTINLSQHQGPDTSSPGAQIQSERGTSTDPDAYANVEGYSLFEGDTALNSHSEFAKDVVERAVSDSPSTGQNAAIASALRSLQGIVNIATGQSTKSNDGTLLARRRPCSLSDVSYSSFTTVSALLEKLPVTTTSITTTRLIDPAAELALAIFTLYFPFLDIVQLRACTDDVYSRKDQAPLGRRLLVFGCLWFLFDEHSRRVTDSEAAKCHAECSVKLRENFEILIDHMPLAMPPSLENIEALIIAVSSPYLCNDIGLG